MNLRPTYADGTPRFTPTLADVLVRGAVLLRARGISDLICRYCGGRKGNSDCPACRRH